MLGNKLIYLKRVAAPKLGSFKMINLVAKYCYSFIVGGGIVDLKAFKMLMMQALIW
jgi:hypothetical protein